MRVRLLLIPPRLARLAGRWYHYLREPARFARSGWMIIPRVGGGAPNTIPGFIRIRVVDRNPLFWYKDGFEQPSWGVETVIPPAAGTAFLWHTGGNEAGTDNSLNYWSAVSGGAWSFASHIATPPAATADAILRGGHADWDNSNHGINWLVRISDCRVGGMIGCCVSGSGDGYYVNLEATNQIRIYKRASAAYVGLAAAQSFTWAAGNVKWLYIALDGTTLTYGACSDSAGAPGALTSFTVTDSTFTGGKVAIRANTTVGTTTFFGNFPFVATVRGPMPNFWYPVVTAGEPAFSYSKVSPQAGTYSLSVELVNSGGSGAWARTPPIFGGSKVRVSAQAKASAGTANVSASGVTTGNAGTAFGLVTGFGAMTGLAKTGGTPPTVSLNYSGAVGLAYFDSLFVENTDWLITDNLPHPHKVSFTVRALWPGAPSSNALGSFTAPLWAPGSPEYKKAKPIYDKLDKGQRVEFYLGYSPESIPLTVLKYAGRIDGLPRTIGGSGSYSITGHSDLAYANLSRPFPGDALRGAYGGVTTALDYRQARVYMGTNEFGGADSFNPFVAGNFVSTFFSGGSAANWSADSDEGLPVVKASTGNGILIFKLWGGAAGDGLHNSYAETSVRIKTTSASATQAGRVGVGLTASLDQANWNSIQAYVQLKWNAGAGTYDADIVWLIYQNDGGTAFTSTNFLTDLADQDGYVALTIGFLANDVTTVVTINGKPLANQLLVAPGSYGYYPFIYYDAPATGSATAYFAYMKQSYRFTDDVNPAGPNGAAFKSGSIGAAARSMKGGSDPGPTFLEIWNRAATRENWYLRYTPSPYNPGLTGRLLGALDMDVEVGADLTKKASGTFAYKDNLSELSENSNADQLVAGTAAASYGASDGGGVAYWTDIPSLFAYGAFDDQVLALTAPNFAEQRRAAAQIADNKTSVGSGGAKTAVVDRDSSTVDKWREHDRLTIHAPEVNQNRQAVRAIGYDFTEGLGTQSVFLDQFSVLDSSVLDKRTQQGLFATAQKFATR